jgi:hypothetical protein
MLLSQNKFVAVKHQNVVGRFHPVKLIQAEKCAFCTVGKEISVQAEKKDCDDNHQLGRMANNSPFCHFFRL